MLTEDQARLLCEEMGVFELLQNEEEVELLKDNNPQLLEAYSDLYETAYGERL